MTNTELTQAYKIRHALDEEMVNFPEKIAQRLASSRDIALSRKKPAAKVVTVTHMVAAGRSYSSTRESGFTWLKRISLTIPCLALVFGLIGIYQSERHQQIAEAAYIDAQVLSDELPVSAYLDKGFNAYLDKESGHQ